MSYYAYILKSETNNKFYKGQSSNLDKRLADHNLGKTKSTKSGIPWKLVYKEKFDSRKQAIERERFFKSAYGRRFIKSLNL